MKRLVLLFGFALSAAFFSGCSGCGGRSLLRGTPTAYPVSECGGCSTCDAGPVGVMAAPAAVVVPATPAGAVIRTP